MEGINYSVSCYGYAFGFDCFAQQVLFAKGGGGKVVSCYSACYLPVHLLGPGAVDVVCAYACLDVSDGYLLVECCEGCCCTCCCIAVNKNDIGGGLFQYVAHSCEDACCDIVKVLSLFHYVQVVVGGYLK